MQLYAYSSPHRISVVKDTVSRVCAAPSAPPPEVVSRTTAPGINHMQRG